MNVVLCRVLYAHALVAAPRISLGWGAGERLYVIKFFGQPLDFMA